VNVQLSLLAREQLARFTRDTGRNPEFRAAGYLWLATRAEELDELRRALEVQHAAGLDESREVGLPAIARLNPALDLSEVIGGAHCASDGFLRPHVLLEGYLEAAARLGARVRWGAAVTAFEFGPDGAVTTVRTNAGEIAADIVVNAAGPWAGDVARLAGVTLPVVPLRRQVAATVLTRALPAAMPMSIFLDDAFHLRVRDERALLLRASPGAADPYDLSVEPAWVESVAAEAARRVPPLAAVPIDRAACWGGLYEMTPDKHAVLGRASECPNVYLINGSSGHGVMHSPALGKLLAEIVLDGAASSIDVSALRPSRFAEGALNPISDIL
jgi:sarcosine oxidase subunit beta